MAPRSASLFIFSGHTGTRTGARLVFAALLLLVAEPSCKSQSPKLVPAFLTDGMAKKNQVFAELDVAIDAAGDYLIHHTDKQGRFTYVVAPDGTAATNRYNVVRHGGAIYALSELAKSASTSRESKTAIRRTILAASSYLVAHHVDRFELARYGLDSDPANENALAVWSLPPQEIRHGDQRAVKLGGIGLGLVGLCAAHQLGFDEASLPLLRGLGSTIAAMQKPDGHFVSKVHEDRGVDPRFVSLYYPGEAVLGLVRLYRIDRDVRWLEIAGRAIAALILARADLSEHELPADHWLLIAIGELARLVSEEPELGSHFPFSHREMISHAVRIADAMLAEQHHADAAGAFTADRRTTPTSTRLEGIGALLRVLPLLHPARERLLVGARVGTQFLLGCQVREHGIRDGGIPRRCGSSGRESRDRRANEIRIDYVQHALSAFLIARDLELFTRQ